MPSWNDRAFWVLGQRVTLLADAAGTGGAFSLIDITSPPGVPGPPPHFHEDCMESFHVLEGTIEVSRDDETLTLEQGDSCLVPKGCVHTFRNAGSVPARILSVFSPAGFEAFFPEFGTPLDQAGETPPPVTTEVIGRVLAGCSRHGMIVPPPPAGAAG